MQEESCSEDYDEAKDEGMKEGSAMNSLLRKRRKRLEGLRGDEAKLGEMEDANGCNNSAEVAEKSVENEWEWR